MNEPETLYAEGSAAVTYVRTQTRATFANPNLVCDVCGQPVKAYRSLAINNIPCGHFGVTSVCPSWGPVDGCRCTTEKHADAIENGADW